MSAAVDTSKFDSAMRRYLLVTSRDMATALNGKHRDLMFLAAKYAPFQRTEFSAEDYARNRSQAYITFKTIKQYGENPPGSSRARKTKKDGSYSSRKGTFKGPGQVWGMSERNRKAYSLRHRHSGQRGYMASAFIKAGLKFAPAASKHRKPVERYKGARTNGYPAQATASNLVSTVILHWDAKSAEDAASKARLATGGVIAGLREVTRDMEQYMSKKAAGNARSVSS